MKLNSVSPCPQSVSIPFSILLPLIFAFPAKCMQRPQNDPVPHSLWNKNIVEMKDHLERQTWLHSLVLLSTLLLLHPCMSFV